MPKSSLKKRASNFASSARQNKVAISTPEELLAKTTANKAVDHRQAPGAVIDGRHLLAASTPELGSLLGERCGEAGAANLRHSPGKVGPSAASALRRTISGSGGAAGPPLKPSCPSLVAAAVYAARDQVSAEIRLRQRGHDPYELPTQRMSIDSALAAILRPDASHSHSGRLLSKTLERPGISSVASRHRSSPSNATTTPAASDSASLRDWLDATDLYCPPTRAITSETLGRSSASMPQRSLLSQTAIRQTTGRNNPTHHQTSGPSSMSSSSSTACCWASRSPTSSSHDASSPCRAGAKLELPVYGTLAARLGATGRQASRYQSASGTSRRDKSKAAATLFEGERGPARRPDDSVFFRAARREVCSGSGAGELWKSAAACRWSVGSF